MIFIAIMNMDANQLLEKARDMLAERGEEYDHEDKKERNMGRAVCAFNALTGYQMTEEEGWLFMLLLKLSRVTDSDFRHFDSLLDAICYSTLMMECATNE